MVFTLLQRGQLIEVPPVDTALDYFASEGLSRDPMPRGRRGIVGSPQTVRRGIEAVAHEYGAEEVMLVTITYDHEARKRSYELVAKEFGLAPQ
jgi:alkanesulfonate monooxygenase SsuD/methylene tetrahydromethanopterin reductase-like flavin-dependent oxidoreductase (luciferase family)